MSNVDKCPYEEISLKRYEECLKAIYEYEIKKEDFKDLKTYTDCVVDFGNSILVYFWNNGNHEATEEDMAEELEMRLMGYALREMEKNNLISSTFDENGEIYYTLIGNGEDIEKVAMDYIFPEGAKDENWIKRINEKSRK